MALMRSLALDLCRSSRRVEVTIYKRLCPRWFIQTVLSSDRVVLVNNEEHHFYISGVIRPEDIDGLGQIQSSQSQINQARSGCSVQR